MIRSTTRRAVSRRRALTPSPIPPPPKPVAEATVPRLPSDSIALSFFLCCARRPHYFHPPASFDHILPAARRLATRHGSISNLLASLASVGCPIKPQTFLLLLRIYWRGGLYPLALQVFNEMLRWGFAPNTFFRNIVLDVLLRLGRVDEAMRFLQDTRSPNYLTYAIVLTHLCKAGNWVGARGCFKAMISSGFDPDGGTLTAVFGCCSKAGSFSELLQVLAFVVVSCKELTVVIWTSLISRLCRDGRIDEACRIFASMVESGCSPTAATYTTLVKGLFRAGKQDMVNEILRSMASSSCRPDLVLYNVLMDCLSKARRFDDAIDVYLDLHRSKLKPDSCTVSTLIRTLHSSGQISLLPRLIPSSDVSYDAVACNAVLNTLCTVGSPSQAVEFYIDMVEKGINPDNYSYVGLLNSLCQLGKIDYAVNVYHGIAVSDPNLDAHVHAAILSGLIKRGRHYMAVRLFRKAVSENYALDGVCYTTAIHGLFQACLVKEACSLFHEMKQSGMTPNTCTYNVMLRGLCRARDMGAVKQLLKEMEAVEVEMDSISFNTLIVFLIKLHRVSSAAALFTKMVDLSLKPSMATYLLLSQSLGRCFVMETGDSHEGNTIAESGGFHSSNDLLVCSGIC